MGEKSNYYLHVEKTAWAKLCTSFYFPNSRIPPHLTIHTYVYIYYNIDIFNGIYFPLFDSVSIAFVRYLCANIRIISEFLTRIITKFACIVLDQIISINALRSTPHMQAKPSLNIPNFPCSIECAARIQCAIFDLIPLHCIGMNTTHMCVCRKISDSKTARAFRFTEHIQCEENYLTVRGKGCLLNVDNLFFF